MLSRLVRPFILGACLAFYPSSAAAAAFRWHSTLSPHFEVSHESAWTPPGFVINLEKMHNRLRLDLSMFSPWMAKERLKLYLYHTQASYVAGEFSPPDWSNGIAMYDQKLVAVHDQKDRKKLFEVISHETTHLLFEGYWAETGQSPPTWLNEGLAMMEEGESALKPERTDWYQAMAYAKPDSFMPLGEFLEKSPTKDLQDNKDKVTAWYIQAYSLVYFLFRQHNKLQFKTLCERLRDGKDLEESLWVVYRYPTGAKFEKAWREWLSSPLHRRKIEALPIAGAGSASPAGSATPIKFSEYESLRR